MSERPSWRPVYLDEAIRPYEQDPKKYSDMWRKLGTDEAWVLLRDLFHQPPCALVDIAAGDGRDAQYFEKMGYEVTAVEPSKALRQQAAKFCGEKSNICWVDSAFPELAEIKTNKFKMITVGAGFVHIKEADQKASLKSLYELADRGGRVAISLRDGTPDIGRLMFATNPDHFSAWANEFGFKILRDIRERPDPLGRKSVFWNYLMLERQ
jgi:ubiquinone/menaquinone biosynthesis C-methylase UbiE